MTNYKRCCKCKEEKLCTEFSKHKNRADGLNSWCKECNKQNTKQWYEYNSTHHRLTVKDRKKLYRDDSQRYVIEYLLKHPCVDCGERNPLALDFDHKDPSKKEYTIGVLVSNVTGMNFSRLKNEIEKCDVRCANCHRIKTAKEQNHTRYLIWEQMKE